MDRFTSFLILLTLFILLPGRLMAGDCSAVTPLPLLKKTAYKDHQFKNLGENKAIETVTLRKGLSLKIASSGCFDSVSKDISIQADGISLASKDFQEWIGFALKNLKSVERNGDAWPLDSIIQCYEKNRDKIKPIKKDKKQIGRICSNGKATDKDGYGCIESNLCWFTIEDSSKGTLLSLRWITDL